MGDKGAGDRQEEEEEDEGEGQEEEGTVGSLWKHETLNDKQCMFCRKWFRA